MHVSWGTFALVEATRALMRASLEDPLNQKFVLLSEAGIPLYPPDLFYVQLMSEDKSRINSCVDTGVSMQAVQPLTYPAALSVLQHSSGSECDGACVRSAAALTRVKLTGFVPPCVFVAPLLCSMLQCSAPLWTLSACALCDVVLSVQDRDTHRWIRRMELDEMKHKHWRKSAQW